MAAYGTAAALAGQLDLRDDQLMLHTILAEERHADALMTNLAKSQIHMDALVA
jgi:ferritin-like metal-binding protein YciE